jgi:uncharacterized protein (TIGR03435 family)
MTQREKNDRDIVEQHLGLFNSPPVEEMQLAEQRILRRLRSESGGSVERFAAPVDPTRRNWSWPLYAVCAAAAALLFGFWVRTPSVRNPGPGIDVHAVVESADGGLYHVAGGRALHPGERIGAGDIVRTDGGVGTVLALADGSRVELRSQTALLLERADDGVRIRLDTGGVIVSAARQRTGHLYVRTKDVTVSVVGTVFLVNAEEAGSRVAVVQGEVQVQQGASFQRLTPGEQVTTNPIMTPVPVIEELAWSQNAAAHIALLQQSLALLQPPPPVQGAIDAFEVASVRPTGLISGGDRGLGGGNVSSRPAGEPCGSPSFPQIDPRRFSTSDSTLLELILWAYGKDCLIWYGSDFVIGGPPWLKSDGFDVQAIIPEGTPGYTREQVRNHEAPQVQLMLQTLLAERFKLVVRRETRDTPAYNLTVAPGGPKLIAWKEGEPRGIGITGGYRDGQITSVISGSKISVSQLTKLLAEVIRRPVRDRTGITGEFRLRLDFAPLFTDTPMFLLHPDGVASGPSLFNVLQEQLGLKLEPTRAPVEFLTIEHVEKASGN